MTRDRFVGSNRRSFRNSASKAADVRRLSQDKLAQLAAGEVPDVVLVDWNMPEMDGLEFIKAVRRDTRYKGLPVLMVTTETETDQMLRALTAGADEYLMKPFQKESLVDKLRLVGVVR